MMAAARPATPLQSCKTWPTHLGTEGGGGGADTTHLQACLDKESPLSTQTSNVANITQILAKRINLSSRTRTRCFKSVGFNGDADEFFFDIFVCLISFLIALVKNNSYVGSSMITVHKVVYVSKDKDDNYSLHAA